MTIAERERRSGLEKLERALLGIPFARVHTVIPGLVLAAVLGWASGWISVALGENLLGFEKSPISVVMVALVLGMLAGNILRLPAWLSPGFTFAKKKLLRLGIILLGIRLSIGEVVRLGALGVPIVIGCLAGAFVITILLSRWLRLPDRLGTLIAVGTSICGVSAIVAAGPTIDAKEEEITYAIAVITVFGMVATLLYPMVAHLIFGDDAVRAGLFLGTSIHDTSQVTGAGLSFSDLYALPQALDVATVTKLVRNTFMCVVIPALAILGPARNRRERTEGDLRRRAAGVFPFFVVGFLFLALVRTVGDYSASSSGRAFWLLGQESWDLIHGSIKKWALWLLVAALAGVGMSTRFRELRSLGLKPFLVGLGAASMVGAVSLGLIALLGALVRF